MKISRLLLWIVVLAFMLYFLVVLLFSPQYKKVLQYQGDTIKIHRNHYAIPNITANSKKGALYAAGYVMAEDRLFQMHIKRMAALGRLSQMFGNASLPTDIMFRAVGLGYWARQATKNFKAGAPNQYDLYQAFADGVNDYVSDRGYLPIDFYLLWTDFDQWTVQDCFAVTNLLVWGQSTDHFNQYIRYLLLTELSEDKTDQIFPFKPQHMLNSQFVAISDQELQDVGLYKKYNPNRTHVQLAPSVATAITEVGMATYFTGLEVAASNSWVIGGQHTASGMPHMANDPHLQTSIPSQWYQFTMNYFNNGKKHSLSGACITGGLASLIGKSEYVSWGCTNVYTDNQDLYLQELNPEGTHYLLNGQWKKLTLREQTIKIRGQPSLEYTVKNTHRGPLLEYLYFASKLYKINIPLSLAWVNYNAHYSYAAQALVFNQIDNFEDLKMSLAEGLNDAPSVNLVYITRDNHIGLQTVGSYPIINQQEQLSGFIKDGRTTKHDWVGVMKGKDRPRISDPQKGYIVNANHRLTTENFLNGRYATNWLITARGLRIDQIIKHKIEKGHKFTIEDSKYIQLDTVDVFCRRMRDHLITLSSQFKNNFVDFDCNFTSESSDAALYSMFMYVLEKRLKPKLKSIDLNLEGTLPYNHHTYRYILNTSVDDHQQMRTIKAVFKQAETALTEFFLSNNKDSWQWGKLHTDHMEHRPFSRTILARFFEKNTKGRGNQNTPNVAFKRKLGLGDWRANHRAGVRIVTTYEQGKSEWIIDSGASEFFLSKHYDDQYKLFMDNKYLKMEDRQQGSAAVDL